jgi:hypothetical protein
MQSKSRRVQVGEKEYSQWRVTIYIGLIGKRRIAGIRRVILALFTRD